MRIEGSSSSGFDRGWHTAPRRPYVVGRELEHFRQAGSEDVVNASAAHSMLLYAFPPDRIGGLDILQHLPPRAGGGRVDGYRKRMLLEFMSEMAAQFPESIPSTGSGASYAP